MMTRRSSRTLTLLSLLCVSGAVALLINNGVISTPLPETVATSSVQVSAPKVHIAVAAPTAVESLLVDLTLSSPKTASALDRWTAPGSCVLVGDVDRPLFVANPEQPLLPASTQKLFVAAAALTFRDEEGRPLQPFTTSARVLNPPVNGVVTGDLYIVGTGDPLLSTSDYGNNLGARDGRTVPYTDLNKLAISLKDAGITQITGNIVGDGDVYGGPLLPQGWESYVQQGAVGPISGLSVNDGYASGSTRIVVSDPPAVVAATLKSSLADVGISVGGQSTSGVAPLAASDLAVLTGAPIQDVVAQMLQYSDNNTAESLARHLGVASGASTPVTVTDAMNAVTQVLTKRGLTLAQVRLDDASGLTRTNLATCESLAQVLTLIPDSALLAQNSQTGTLDERLGAFPGRLNAKTGTLNGVSSLAGFLEVANTTEIPIVMIYNGSGASEALKAAEDQAIAQLLAREIGAP